MRAFIGIDLPFKTKDKISKIQEDLKALNLKLKWANSKNIHLTLKFLGNIKELRIPEIKEAINKTTKDLSAFEISLKDFGFFPNQNKPRVFFIETSKANLLKSIADKLEDSLAKIGFEKEGRFKSHITLARIKALDNIALLKDKIETIKLEEKFQIKAVTLYQSTLTPDGPIYKEIYTNNLATLRIKQA